MADIYDKISKEYGDGIVRSGQDIIEHPKDIISFSPSLDIVLGGGVQVGSIVVLTGNPKCGKTTSALHLAGNAQKAGMEVVIANIEGRLKRRDLLGIKNLNAANIKVIGSWADDTNMKILHGEDYLNITENIVNNTRRSFIILDSVSTLCASKRQDSEVEKQFRAPEAMLMANFLRNISNILPVSECIIVSITHLVANTGGMGQGYAETGGRKLSYMLDVRLRAKSVTPWDGDKETADPIGQIVTWETSSSSLTSPFKKIDSYIRYGYGIDELAEIIYMGISYGIIKQSGSWYSIENIKVQGQPKLYQALLEKSDLVVNIKKQILELAT